MKKTKILLFALLLGVSARAADFPIVYSYDSSKPQQAFELNVPVPDGNYLVTLELGSRKRAGRTFVKSESRRLSVNDLPTAKGEFRTVSFLVNKRDKTIREGLFGRHVIVALGVHESGIPAIFLIFGASLSVIMLHLTLLSQY